MNVAVFKQFSNEFLHKIQMNNFFNDDKTQDLLKSIKMVYWNKPWYLLFFTYAMVESINVVVTGRNKSYISTHLAQLKLAVFNAYMKEVRFHSLLSFSIRLGWLGCGRSAFAHVAEPLDFRVSCPPNANFPTYYPTYLLVFN